MFSSSVINTAAPPGSSNPTTHPHQHQHLPVSSYSHSGVFSDHYNTNLVPGIMVAQDAQHDHVLIESTISNFNSTMDHKEPAGSVARVCKKKKCDKRSKIRTSQGLRDRRVRLSIEIARKFFDIQDRLGFDKPSRTVEWLLTKSNKSILKLSSSSTSSSPLLTTSSEEAAGTEEDGFKSLSLTRRNTNQIHQVSCGDSLKTMKKQQEAALILTRESRERARARARARTLAKLHQQQLIHSYVHPNSNLSSPDWDTSSAIPLPSSSATNRLNFSRDVEIYTISSWEQLLHHNYRPL